MVSSKSQKNTLHSLLSTNLKKLTITLPPSSSSSSTTGTDFDFSDVFGPPPLTPHHLAPPSPSTSASPPPPPPPPTTSWEPPVIHNRSHSFVGPSPRYTASPPSLPFHAHEELEAEEEDLERNGVGLSESKISEGSSSSTTTPASTASNNTGGGGGGGGERQNGKLGPADFEILRVVGRGAFGKVFQVRLKRKKSESGDGDGIYAMKVMRKDGIIKKNHVGYMKAERDILTKTVHPFIVQLRFSFQIMLTDFGLAKEIDESSRSNSMCGTTEYMAPEILLSKGHNKDADWWSVGILLYEMLTGQPPFTHSNRKKLQERIIKEKVKLPPYLSSEAHSLLKGLLQKEPSKRLGSGPGAGDEVKRHKWFQSINWKKLEARELQPKFKPDVTGKDCTSNFDQFWTTMPPDDSPASTPTTTGEHFQGYTYVAPNPWLSSDEK